MPFKNNLHAAGQNRPDVARKRERWKRHQARLDPRRLVFIDETWAKTNMIRTHGRCARGQRLVDRVPQGHWKTMTFLAALRCDRIDAPFVLDGPINGAWFQAYVEQLLVPTLSRGDVVIMDNLGSHKGKAPPGHPTGGRTPDLPAALQPRPQSYRTGLRQAESTPAQSRRANRRSHLATHRRTPRLLHAGRVRHYLANSGYAST